MTIQEQEIHLLEENRALLLQLLEDNDPVKFQEQLNKTPNYIEMRCIGDDKVCFWLTLLIFVSCEFVLDNYWNCSLLVNVLYFI